MSDILAALARESLLSERVISMEADGKPSNLPAINADMPQNTTPASERTPGSSNAAPANGQTGASDAPKPGEGEQEPKKEEEPPKDAKRLLLGAGLFGVRSLKAVTEMLASDAAQLESEYGDTKAKGITDMVSALTEMETMLTEMYDAKDAGDSPVQPEPAEQNPAPVAPVTQNQMPVADVQGQPEA